MSWSKLDLVSKAFAQIGLPTYVFDASPEEIQDVTSTMDSMLAMWNAEGIRLGYNMSSTVEVDDSLDSEVRDAAYMAIYLNLALIIGPGIGRQISPVLLAMAKSAKNTLTALFVVPHPTQLPGNMPAGQGHKGWRGWDRTFLNPNRRHLGAGQDTRLSLRGKKQNQ